MNSKRVVKLVGFSCLVLVWVVNMAATPAPTPQVSQGSSLAPGNPLPPASTFPAPRGLLEAQTAGSPFTLAYSWTKNWGHPSGDASAAGVAVDRWGNLYVSGQFKGTVNFDPAGANPSATFASNNSTVDAYLLKLDAHGRYQWVKTWGAGSSANCSSIGRSCGRDAANGVVVDAAGNAYVAGLLQNTVNFGNGHTAVSNAPNGSNNIFLARFSAD